MAEKLPPARTLQHGDIVEVSFANTRWSVTLPPTGKVEDIENPEFWRHVVKQKLKVGQTIEVRTIDHLIYAEAYVRATDPVAVVQLLRVHRLGQEIATEPEERGDNFRIQYVPAKKAHCVYAGKDLLREGFQTREQAAAWIEHHKAQL
jgi:acetamidase/formamidase